MMNRILSTALLVAGALALLPAVAVRAQSETTTTTTAVTPALPVVPAARTTTTVATTTAEGTIQEFTPGSSRIVVRTSAGAPVTYSYSKKTTFVDAVGNVVAAESIKSGEPTTVYYDTEEGQPVITKVVVRRTAAVPVAPVVPATRSTTTTETTTTTTK